MENYLTDGKLSNEPNVIPLISGGVRGFLHQPLGNAQDALILTHGAGANAQAPLLVAAASAFARAGISTLRCDLPFRQRKPHGPPSPADAIADRANLREAVDQLRALVKGSIFLGGHSYGGRQATMLAAEDSSLADALLLFSYPLHPPNQPGKKRTAHFPHLQTPAMFIHGIKDPFGSPDEMRAALSLVPAATSLVLLDRGGHDLLRGKFDFLSLVIDPFLEFMKR